MKRKGISIPTILTLLLTVAVLIGFGAVYASFHTDADIPMRAMEIAGQLTNVNVTQEKKQQVSAPVTLSTQAPQAAVGSVPQPVMPQPVLPKVKLTLAGTIAFESDLSDVVYNRADQQCDYQGMLSAIRNDNTGEIRLASVSQALTAQGRDYNDQVAQISAAQEILAAGFNAAVIEGNVLETGASNAAKTAEILYNSGIHPIGLNSAPTAQIVYLEQNGIRFAVISFTEKLSNKASSALQSTSGQGILSVNSRDDLLFEVQQAKMQGAQCVILYYQWADQNTDKVTDNMRTVARELTSAGVDILVGTGPTRLLPATLMRTADENGNEREALILYSMGTLISESREGYDLSGALVHVQLTANGNGVKIDGLDYTPTYIWRQPENGVNRYRVINSGLEAPQGMTDRQKSVMERCLKRTEESMGSLKEINFTD